MSLKFAVLKKNYLTNYQFWIEKVTQKKPLKT